MLSGSVIATIFGVICLLVLVISLATGATMVFPSKEVIRFRKSPVYFCAAVCFWLFCVVAAGLVALGRLD
jgi:hypothetical protein